MAVAVCFLTNPKQDRVGIVATVPAGSQEQAAYSEKRYTYEKEGFLGDFQITFYDDGTFTYYEGPASSYLGNGTWNQEGDMITLIDETDPAFVNYFRLDGDDLVFVEKGSSNFIYVKVTDGDRFTI